MGLSASQARLLTITARKSDCEYESMRLSHQKIALSRDMERLSAEYDTEMAQTKLVWDYYGTDSETTDLTYGLLMTPSAINNYTPSPITDSSGRVVLDDRLAIAAKAAGIPQEGLDGLPSSDVRNKFIDSLVSTGYISEVQGENIKKTTYNQAAGVGSSDLVNVNTKEGTLQDLIEMVSSNYYDFSDLANGVNTWEGDTFAGGFGLNIYDNGENINTGGRISLGDLLSGNYSLRGNFDQLPGDKSDDPCNGLWSWAVVDNVATSSFWDAMFDNFRAVLDTGDEQTQAAIAYAERMVRDTVECLSDVTAQDGHDTSNYAYYKKFDEKRTGQDDINSELENNTDSHIGIVYVDNGKDDWSDPGHEYNDGYGINLSNMAKAYLTYFAQYMEGIGSSTYNVEKTVADSNLIDDMFTFTLVTDVDTSGDNLLIAAFWDTLFNQICTKGWTENDNVNNQDYLQESLKNGSMYISSLADDGYYYQGNYATHTYIQEVTDEEGIAQAEARYNREKSKINTKENILDMKIKNLDTEISSLSTEYDTIKSVISKNIEKVFKRYNA